MIEVIDQTQPETGAADWMHAPGPRGTARCRPAKQDRIGQSGPVTCPKCNPPGNR